MYRRVVPKRGVAAVAAALGLVLALSVTDAAGFAPPSPPTDAVTATGNGTSYGDISISAQSGPGGENPRGQASFLLFRTEPVSGPVTCLNVTGPDAGAGTPGSPTDAVLNVQTEFGVVTVELVDKGGDGTDTMSALGAGRAPGDCSPFHNAGLNDVLTSGRALVFDAPLRPTTAAQCRHDGWRAFGFESEGRCVSFVVQSALNGCLAERATIGPASFRAKYGIGPVRRLALLRCVLTTTGF